MAEEHEYSLEEFVATCSLPRVAKVTQGYCSENDCNDHDFSTNDVIKVSNIFWHLAASFFYCVDYAVARCPSVRPSVCLSHAGIVSKRINISSSNFFHRRVAEPFYFSTRNQSNPC